MHIAHFDIDSLGRICIDTMLRRLFDQFLTMRKDKSLVCPSWERLDAVDELRKDNLCPQVSMLSMAYCCPPYRLAATCSQ